MTEGYLENLIAGILEAKLSPLTAEVRRVAGLMETLRAALPPILVDVPEAAKRLGVSESSIRRRVKDGSMPIKRVGARIKVDLGALQSMPDAKVIELVRKARSG